MHNNFHFLQDLLVLFGLGLVAVVLFHRIKLPAVLAFLVTGVICGPYGFGFINDVESISALAEIGVVLLLFTLGIEFSIPHFMRMRRFLLLGGALQVGLTLVATAAVTLLTGASLALSIFIGMLMAISSTARVLRILESRRELDSAQGRNALTILIFQDLCIVPMVLLTPFLGGKEMALQDVVWIGGKAILFVLLSFTVVRFCLPWILNHVAQTRKREAFILCIIFLCLGTAWGTAHVGLSMALGAFVAGLVLSESKYNHQALGEIVPFREIFNCLVFVSIGMLFDVRTVLEAPLLVAGCVLVVLVGKAAIAAGVTRVLGHSIKVSILTGLALAQTSEFAFVLGKVGLDNGVIDAKTNQLFLAVAILSMMVSPAVIGAGPGLLKLLERILPKSLASRLSRGIEPAGGTAKLEDHVIIVGYELKGQHLARVLSESKIPYVVIDNDPLTVRTEKKKGLNIVYGDATSQEVLQHAGIETARVLALTFRDHTILKRATELGDRLNHSLHIIAGAGELSDVRSLVKRGADEVVPDQLVTSIDFFHRVLDRYLVAGETIDRYVNEVQAEYAHLTRALFEKYRGSRLQHVPFSLVMSVYRVEEGSRMAGKNLGDCGLRGATGATVVAVQSASGTNHVNPISTDLIEVGDAVMVLGRPDQVAEAALFFSEPGSSRESV